MIFVDSINEKMALIKYLCSKLLDNLKDKVKEKIYLNLSNKSKKLFAKDFF